MADIHQTTGIDSPLALRNFPPVVSTPLTPQKKPRMIACLVALVTQMLDLNKRLQDAKLEQEKMLLSRQAPVDSWNFSRCRSFTSR